MAYLRVWVGELSAYNNGILHGDWIDVEDREQFDEEVQKIIKSSPKPDAEEWDIFDIDASFNHNNESIDELIEILEFCEEHGEDAEIALEMFDCLEDAKRFIDDIYFTESYEDLARELLDDQIPANLSYYFDYAQYGEEYLIDAFQHNTSDGIWYCFT